MVSQSLRHSSTTRFSGAVHSSKWFKQVTIDVKVGTSSAVPASKRGFPRSAIIASSMASMLSCIIRPS